MRSQTGLQGNSLSFQPILIYSLTTAKEAAETVLQLLTLGTGHFLKDDLVEVASICPDGWQNGLQALTTGIACPMLATLLQPELRHGIRDLFLNILLCTGTIVDDNLLRDQEGACNG